ncbi:hypothetical protein Xen7305DRAFT_00005690 [Xenococcus sp. PCC 7305]|uniref:antibiotic biosynthesis monooxygenase n=1 Tax=Xenococcus sp. PCC 7305 TaxID=102125 RepID=UPI0002ABB860|nr:antibiotic biosynthesis monooxygenase [Xenococcus sp. PCC 7305]ELS00868.1 hypothetical protein Xen7305DRAFT_00005690 [Xenococcus sp. PCC 7305]
MNEKLDTLDPPVTVVISRKVQPECKAAFEEFISGITSAAATFEGHLGVNISRPRTPEDNEYKIVFKFDRASNLRIWQESECRRQWLARAESLCLEKPTVQILTGLETWFTLQSAKSSTPPPRHKMATIILLTIVPIKILTNFTLIPLLTSLPFLLRILITSAIMVLMMTFVIMPRMTRLFSKWLYPNRTT